ncbi:kinase-like protein [Hymenopellis radicata]|nr:kinase-like protein [Hymenopellis radicata]
MFAMKNILPFYGVSEDIFPSGLCLVLPWMEHGDIHHFLGKNPQHDRRGWILDVASGMRYLHNLDPCIIHKDIRGANILVGDNHRCYLADFGISFLIETQMPGTATRSRGNIRWLPPELVVFDAKPDVGLLRQADIYSFGCTVIEIYSGHPPYSDLPTDAAIVNRISQKERPPHPSFDELPPGLWYTVVFRCLSPLPQDRPLGDEIIRCLWDLDEDYLTQYLEVCKSGPSPTYTPR